MVLIVSLFDFLAVNINNCASGTSLKTTTKQAQIKTVDLAKLKNRRKSRPRTRKIIFSKFVRSKLSEYLVSFIAVPCYRLFDR